MTESSDSNSVSGIELMPEAGVADFGSAKYALSTIRIWRCCHDTIMKMGTQNGQLQHGKQTGSWWISIIFVSKDASYHGDIDKLCANFWFSQHSTTLSAGGKENHKNDINTMTWRDFLMTLVGEVRPFFERKINVGFFFQKKAKPRPPASSKNRVMSRCLCHFCYFPFPPRRASYCAVRAKIWRIIYQYRHGMMRLWKQNIIKNFHDLV